MTPEEIWRKLGDFGREWRSELVEVGDGFGFRLSLPGGFRPRHAGAALSLGAMVLLRRAEAGASSPTGVTVSIACLGPVGTADRDLLGEVGPLVLRGIRDGLRPEPEQRRCERLPHPRPVWVRPVLYGDVLGEAITGRAFDVSPSGAGLKLPFRPPTSRVCLYVPVEGRSAPLTIRAEVRRVRPAEDGGFEVGLFFPDGG